VSARRRALKGSCTSGGNLSTWGQAAFPYEEHASVLFFFQPQGGHAQAARSFSSCLRVSTLSIFASTKPRFRSSHSRRLRGLSVSSNSLGCVASFRSSRSSLFSKTYLRILTGDSDRLFFTEWRGLLRVGRGHGHLSEGARRNFSGGPQVYFGGCFSVQKRTLLTFVTASRVYGFY